jgi:hypothetical protein
MYSGKSKRKAKKRKQAAFMERTFGVHFEPFSKDTWRKGDPANLEEIDHLGNRVWIGRYQGKDELSPEFRELASGTIVNDPGGCFIGIAYILDRSLIVYGPSLSGDMSVERKNIDKWQTLKDVKINAHPDVISANTAVDVAVKAWKAAPAESRKLLHDEKVEKEKDVDVTRDRVAGLMPDVMKLLGKMRAAESRMLKEKKRVHQAIADFTLCFERIVWPDFGKDQKMFKKKPGGLSGWWRNKISSMGHATLTEKLERGASIRGRTMVAPSEACSTMLCGDCGNLANQGLNQCILFQGTSRVHNCPNPDCRSKAPRDGSGRSIAAMMFARILCFRDKPRDAAPEEGEIEEDEIEEEDIEKEDMDRIGVGGRGGMSEEGKDVDDKVKMMAQSKGRVSLLTRTRCSSPGQVGWSL